MGGEEDEDREKKEKEAERMKLRQKYGGCAFAHMQHMTTYGADYENNGNSHNHSHDHKKHHHGHDHSHGHSSKPKSSCGYMPIEEIKRLSEERKKDTVTVEEKNKKKIKAVYAAKEDG